MLIKDYWEFGSYVGGKCPICGEAIFFEKGDDAIAECPSCFTHLDWPREWPEEDTGRWVNKHIGKWSYKEVPARGNDKSTMTLRQFLDSWE